MKVKVFWGVTSCSFVAFRMRCIHLQDAFGIFISAKLHITTPQNVIMFMFNYAIICNLSVFPSFYFLSSSLPDRLPLCQVTVYRYLLQNILWTPLHWPRAGRLSRQNNFEEYTHGPIESQTRAPSFLVFKNTLDRATILITNRASNSAIANL